MAEWKAQTYGTVKYDFRPDANVQGTTPDPSDELLKEYFDAVKKFMDVHEVNNVPTEQEMRRNPELVQEALERISNIDKIEVSHELASIVANLCQNKPSVEEILMLPFRKRMPFIRWIQKELTDPEG